VGVVGFLFGVTALGVIYALTPVPTVAQADATAEGSTLYFRDNKTRLARLGVNRQPVTPDQVPEVVREAVLAAEHRDFYTEPGVSARGTIRGLWSTVTGKQVQGGSTITQQLVRNYYEGFSRERTLTRKFKEILVSIKVDRERSKEWILEQYLNTIYLGRDAYGIQAAARAYYKKDVDELTAAEAAYLAGTIQLPTYFAEPYGANRGAAEARWRYVVNGMVKTGAITPAQAQGMTFPQPPKHRPTDIYEGPNGYLIHQAKLELRRQGYSEDAINRGGLRVVTTFDAKLSKAAVKAVKDIVPPNAPDAIQTGMVAINPDNGEVIAFYGGRDFLEDQYDNAFSSTAQAGSGFKPYVLAAALDDGKPLTTLVDGHSPQIFAGKPVRNNANQQYGTIDLVTATRNSVNTAYVNLAMDIGLDKVVETAERAGIPKAQLTANDVDKAPTLALGAASVSPLQQAGGYAAFAAEGTYHRPHVIRSVTGPDGDTRKLAFGDNGKHAFDSDSAKDATYAMRKVVEGGTGTGARLADGRPVAGKTGTTDGGKAIWFNGFVPQMATSVGMFRDDNKPLKIPGYSAYGGQLPARIWQTFMTEAMRGEPVKQFGAPSRQVPTARPSPDESESQTERPDPSPTGEDPPDTEPPPRPTPTLTIIPPTPSTPPEDRRR
jgi:membrane peptidoglycan carboxypeptidase